jgi:glycosyltransferase involved in cell wall biosynthesis
MRIAFYAPLKPPDHPTPSGDRQVCRNLIRALEGAGHRVELASRLGSRDGEGDAGRQSALRQQGAEEAERLLRDYRSRSFDARPDLWFTYHLYYKAPDWIVPAVASRLAIPYVVAEASVAPKRAQGPWAEGHVAVLSALRQAALVLTLNPADAECLPNREKSKRLHPFLDTGPYRAASSERGHHRGALARQTGLDPARPWLLAVAMMRFGDKLASYRVLADALAQLDGQAWCLLIVGDGEAREEVAAAFEPIAKPRIRFMGERQPEDLPAIYAACDILAWPAVNEAYGMTLLEAQATGLPVVAGHTPGVAAIVRDQDSGLLTEAGSPARFAAALGGLLKDAAARGHLARAAAEVTHAEHGLEAAAARLDRLLRTAAA